MAEEAKETKTKMYQVTKGNFATGYNGQKGEGEKVELTAAQAGKLRSAGVIK